MTPVRGSGEDLHLSIIYRPLVILTLVILLLLAVPMVLHALSTANNTKDGPRLYEIPMPENRPIVMPEPKQ